MGVRKVEKLLVVDVTVASNRLRTLNTDALSSIKQSMASIGLRTPITVRIDPKDEYPEPILVSGHHRLEAARQLGWDYIECFITEDADEDRARMWEIAENLHRSDLTALQRSEHIAEWVRLAEKQSCQVETKGHRPQSGVNKAARDLGIGQTEAHRAIKVGGLTQEAKEAAREARLDNNQSAMLLAAKEAPERQVQRISEIAAAKAYKVAADPVDDQQANERQVARLMDAWNAAGPDARAEFLLRIDQPIMDRRFA